jgi:hypothetical protein
MNLLDPGADAAVQRVAPIEFRDAIEIKSLGRQGQEAK